MVEDTADEVGPAGAPELADGDGVDKAVTIEGRLVGG